MMPQHAALQTLPALVSATACARWLAAIDARLTALSPSSADWAASGASLRLSALGAALWDELLRVLLDHASIRQALHERLGAQPLCMASQCWVRQQFPAHLRPAGQHPHQWHQDGALGSRFDAIDEALGRLVTLWLPLVDCGLDAPSLEWLDVRVPDLLQPPALTEQAVLQRFGAACRQHAELQAGDALLFDGSVLHRSHVLPDMAHRRVSIEWRFVSEQTLLPRWAAEDLQSLPV